MEKKKSCHFLDSCYFTDYSDQCHLLELNKRREVRSPWWDYFWSNQRCNHTGTFSLHSPSAATLCDHRLWKIQPKSFSFPSICRI